MLVSSRAQFIHIYTGLLIAFKHKILKLNIISSPCSCWCASFDMMDLQSGIEQATGAMNDTAEDGNNNTVCDTTHNMQHTCNIMQYRI